jgi:arsenite-transporting ATPase
MFGATGRAVDLAHDRGVIRSLIDLAPPGLDEVAAVLEISDALTGISRDLVVMDTAPTGHALRLLQMPALIHEWTHALMKILLKYQSVTGLGELAESLVGLSASVGRLRRLLADSDRCAFVAVTRPAALPRLETTRLLKDLSQLEVHVPAIVINAVGRGTCARCRRNAAAEQREIRGIHRAGSRQGIRVVMAGAVLPPPHGIPSLRRWGKSSWRSTTGYHQDR